MKRLVGLCSVVALLALAGCSGDPESAPVPLPATSTPASSSETSPTSASPRPSASPSPTRTPSPTPSPTPSKKPNPISVQALIEKRYDGADLRRRELLTDAGPYKRYRVTYESEGLTISGIMNVPDGKGPFPVIVLAHGYINPDTYFPGQGMPREQDLLARAGYAVLHTDYRGHATGDDDKNVDYELRLPYAVDVVNAAAAIRESDLDYLDKDRIGVFGRSMGGNVVENAIVADPDAFDAAVVWASTSSLAADNWRQFYRDGGDRDAVNDRIEAGYGLPEDAPEFWRAASPRDYFDRVTIPVQLHHGSDDDTCPISWSRATEKAMTAAGVDAELFTYDGAGHTFEGRAFTRGIERTTTFFDKTLR